MQVRRWRALVCAVALTASVAWPSAAQQPPLRGIWISPVGSASAIPAVMRYVRQGGLDTVVVPVFYDGRTLYPSRVFPQHDRYLGSDPAAAVVAQAHRRNLRVLAALDVLYWQSSARPSGAVASHPEWVERIAEGSTIGDVAGQPGAFASPSEPRVKSLLAGLASELAARYDFDGLVLDYARWSRLDFLGYAGADRRAYILAHRVDPLDIDLLGYATPDDMIEGLVRWQEQQITAVTEAVAQAFRRAKPQATVLAVVEPGYYANRTINPVRQDWRSWLGRDWLTAVMPDRIVYTDPESARSQLQAAAGMAGAPMVALIRPARGQSVTRQMQVVSALGLQGFILWGRDSLQQRRQVLAEIGGM